MVDDMSDEFLYNENNIKYKEYFELPLSKSKFQTFNINKYDHS
jgi:hypothetical protein